MEKKLLMAALLAMVGCSRTDVLAVPEDLLYPPSDGGAIHQQVEVNAEVNVEFGSGDAGARVLTVDGGVAGDGGLPPSVPAPGEESEGLAGGAEGPPVLFRAIPERGCRNKDALIQLRGHLIHWDSTVTIEYPHDNGFAVIDQSILDECENPILDWQDILRTTFRTHPDLEWSDGGGYHTGYYLVHVTNPDGAKSNRVGLYLSDCGDEVLEVRKGCQ